MTFTVSNDSAFQVFEGQLDHLAVSAIQALTAVMLKSPAAKVKHSFIIVVSTQSSDAAFNAKILLIIFIEVLIRL